MSKKTLSKRIKELSKNMCTDLQQKLAEVPNVAATADLWSKAKRSFLGMTVHWIDDETLERKSAALAFKRVLGRHTYDVLAEEISSILQEFQIQNKVSGITTDNGSNFVKAFKMFQELGMDGEDDDDLEIEFHSLTNILDSSDGNENENLITLPPHYRCGNHTLNLIAVKDTETALEDKQFKKVSRSTFSKLSKLWNKQHQSTQATDKIKSVLGVYLETPNLTSGTRLSTRLIR